jgi:hypothetical protein
MAIEHELKRIADALEQLVGFFGELVTDRLHPRVPPPELDAGVPTDAFITQPSKPVPPLDANLAFIAGRWKRRQGDVLHGPPAPAPHVTQEEGSHGQATNIDRE